jgi:hypothetical protein
VAETLDWLTALIELDQQTLDPDLVDSTLGVILKYQDDVAHVHGELAAEILSRTQVEG